MKDVTESVPGFLVWSEASYGPYYWPRAEFLLPHLLGGLIAIVIGPFQFWPRIRNNYPKIHRISGRVYLTSVLIGALAGMAMALTSGVNLAYASGLFALAMAWMLTSGMALTAILKRNFIQHKQWMVRSYVVSFAFVSFRIVDDVMTYYGLGEDTERLAMLAWGCWAVPLLLTEAVIQSKQVFAQR